jgi:branched-chain amino acid transport system ATP-binding protein
MEAAQVLELSKITKKFGGLSAVTELDLKLEKNQIHALIGPNGAGKTTVFNMITGAYQVTSGSIHFNGKKINGVPPYKIVELGIARTYQNIRLFKQVSALQNVMTGFHCRTTAGVFNILYNRKKMLAEEAETRRQSEEILKYLDIYDMRDTKARNLPYGHQRLLEIARALATRPSLLLLDEPAAGMNSEEKQLLISTIRRIRQDFDLSVLLVEHDMDLIMNISDEITVLNYGKRIANGKPKEIQNNDMVIEAYLGRSKNDDE